VVQASRQDLIQQLALVTEAQARTRVGQWSPADQAVELLAWLRLEQLNARYRAALDQASAPPPA
jgi:hypothetical protein